MLKQNQYAVIVYREIQPPSGGCVLKLLQIYAFQTAKKPAAFGRLCVETLKTLA